MRFLHLADLHFGKSIYGTSLLESGDQGAWVDRFLELAESVRRRKEKADRRKLQKGSKRVGTRRTKV